MLGVSVLGAHSLSGSRHQDSMFAELSKTGCVGRSYHVVRKVTAHMQLMFGLENTVIPGHLHWTSSS